MCPWEMESIEKSLERIELVKRIAYHYELAQVLGSFSCRTEYMQSRDQCLRELVYDINQCPNPDQALRRVQTKQHAKAFRTEFTLGPLPTEI